MNLFTTLDRLKADLDILRPLAPEQEQRVMQKFRLEWNYNSNAIEGNSLTLGETRSLLLHGLTAAGKPIRDHIDIRGHNEAVLWLEDFVRDERPLTEQFIRGMHEVLLGEPYEVLAQTPDGQPTHKTIQPGQYKTSPNNVLTSTGEMFYFASPEETPAKMTELVDWYRAEDAEPTMHPVALAAEFHYRFVRIHPFGDGNGRMSRLLMNLILLRRGYSITVIRAIDRNRYLAALSAADANDPEPFLRFVVENVEASLRLMIRAAKGEAIDEPDDLDKKLALLRKQVLSREDTIEMTWNSETQTNFYRDLLEMWLNDAAQEMERFDDLFLEKKTTFTYHLKDAEHFSGTKAETLAETISLAEITFSTPDKNVDHAFVKFEWKTFRMVRKRFDFRLLIDFRFAEYEFEVLYRLFEIIDDSSIVKPEFMFLTSSVYKPLYNHIHFKEINHQLANKVYDFIAAKVADAASS